MYVSLYVTLDDRIFPFYTHDVGILVPFGRFFVAYTCANRTLLILTLADYKGLGVLLKASIYVGVVVFKTDTNVLCLIKQCVLFENHVSYVAMYFLHHLFLWGGGLFSFGHWDFTPCKIHWQNLIVN